MHVTIVSATVFEVAPLLTWLEKECKRTGAASFERGDLAVEVLVCGIGAPATSLHLGRFFAVCPTDFAINAGIAGAFDPALSLGSVVQTVTERWGDLGAEEADGRFIDLNEMGFSGQPLLANPLPPIPSLQACNGLTVNKVHGSAASIEAILGKYPDVQVESMEGAAFFQACLAFNVRFAQIRAISNRVEPRNREAWDIPLAIGNLNAVLVDMLEGLAGPIPPLS